MPKYSKTPNRNDMAIERDLAAAKMYYRAARTPLMKQAYYKLWYAILVMKHRARGGL